MMSVDHEKLIRIQRIQRKFQEDLPPDKRLKYLQYLSGITISLSILKETSIGKTVNLMRKDGGVIGTLAAQIYSKWKEIAASEYNNPTPSKQQTDDKNEYNKKHNSVKQNSSGHSNSSLSDRGTSHNRLTNGIVSSSTSCRPKVPEDEKPKKQKNISSAHANKNMSTEYVKEEDPAKFEYLEEEPSLMSGYIKEEPSDDDYVMDGMSPQSEYIKHETLIKSEDIDVDPSTESSYIKNEFSMQSKFIKNEPVEPIIKSEPMEDDSFTPQADIASSSKSKIAKLNSKKDKSSKSDKSMKNDKSSKIDKSLKSESIVKDNLPSTSEKDNSEPPKKKQVKSFEEMLMMPIFPTKKKKKKKQEATKKSRLLDTPMKSSTLPDVELPQTNTVPVYRPSRPLPTVTLEEPKKKAPEPPPPTIRYADITSRKTKSVMFSGKKNYDGVVLSLQQMCMRILIENVDALYETGGVPFMVLEPLLSKCSPPQLERLEFYNPHFIQDTDQLWKKHCLLEFKGKKIDEDSVGAWRDMYKELFNERELKLQRLSNKIITNQAQKAPERSVKLAFVATAPKPSAQVLRVQKRKEKMKEMRKKEKEKEEEDNREKQKEIQENREKQKEIRDRMMKEQQEASDVHVPFTNVPRRDRCSKRPPTSLSSSASNLHPEPKKSKKKDDDDDELGSCAPPEFTPAPKKKKGKNPMMLKALKLLNKQKSRMGAQIMRK